MPFEKVRFLLRSPVVRVNLGAFGSGGQDGGGIKHPGLSRGLPAEADAVEGLTSLAEHAAEVVPDGAG